MAPTAQSSSGFIPAVTESNATNGSFDLRFGASWLRQAHSGPIQLGNLRVDLDAFQARLDDEPVALTSQEFEVLMLLARRAGRLVPLAQIAEALWGHSRRGCGRHLGVVIARLRTKLADAHPYKIETIRQRGYILRASV